MKIEIEIDDVVIITAMKKDYEMLLGILRDLEKVDRLYQCNVEDLMSTIERVKAYEVILRYYMHSADASAYIREAKQKAMVKYV